MSGVNGIHHLTAIAGSPQDNYDFYSKILGLKLVKKTINFDDPFTYHLYFGNDEGSPGTLITFFPWGEQGLRGRRGNGQVTTISFSILPESIDFWQARLNDLNVLFSGPFKRFDEEAILFEDPDGIELELIASSDETRDGWTNSTIPKEHSIRGFFGVALSEENFLKTQNLLFTPLDFIKINEIENRLRYESGNGGPGTYVDILNLPNGFTGKMGIGAVHHVAWRVKDDEHQLELRNELVKAGANVTPVVDRKYFHSIYFREPGNVLFEAATDPPGFLVDEDEDHLGTELKLPSWHEKIRNEIEMKLPALNTIGE